MSRSTRRLRGLSSGERASARRLLDEVTRRLVTPRRIAALVGVAIAVALAAVGIGMLTRWWVGILVAVAGIIGLAALVAIVGLRRSPRLARVVAHRLGLRRLPLGSLDRSPRVGAAARRAAAGYVSDALAELAAIAADPGVSRRERTDAVVALADWWVLEGDPERSLAVIDAALEHTSDLPLDTGDRTFVALRCEALARAGRHDEIRAVTTPDRWTRHPDLALLAANGLGPADRIAVLGGMLERAGHRPFRLAGGTSITDLVVDPVADPTTGRSSHRPPVVSQPLVTVIVPMYDDEATIAWALGSLTAQSWPALEIIVVDDGSHDGSVAIVEQCAGADERIRLVRTTVNGGPYRARARALESASGEYVTVNDADDIAHPDKIATQLAPLIARPELVATLSSLIRMADDLTIVRRGLVPGDVIGRNYSSLMVRRSVLDALGGWDTVRIGADSELFERLRTAHGAAAVHHVEPSVPLAIARHVDSSLTRRPVTRLTTTRHVLGARRMYWREAAAWHRRGDLVMNRSSATTPFHAPAAARYRPGETPEEERRLDVVLLSDLALPGGTTASNLEEITANERAGLRTGLIHHRAHHLRDIDPNPKIIAALSDSTRLIGLGDEITADLVVVKYPPAAMRLPDEFPAVSTGRVVVAVNQTPWTSYPDDGDEHDRNGRRRRERRGAPHRQEARREVYRIAEVDAELRRVFAVKPTWMPIGPAVRATLHRHHADEIAAVDLSPDDWVELIDIDRWRRAGRPAHRTGDPIRIGRHGRDTVWKWPADRQALLAAYPADPRYRVEILGGADAACDVLGSMPSNWRVHEFDTVDPAAFLAGLDVFVNVVHPEMVEAFGRSVLEALAVGVPVITEPRFAELFGDAVICCEADEVTDRVEALMADPDLYERQVERGQALVAARFGHEAHRARLAGLGVSRATS